MSALRFDFRAELGIDYSLVTSGRMSWNETWGHVTELLRKPSSHLVAAIEGHRYVPSDAERAAWSVFEMWLASQSKKGARKLERPWRGQKPTYTPDAVAKPVDAESAARREKLAQMF